MDLILNMQEMAAGHLGGIFVVMSAVVMIIGAWGLRSQFGKHAKTRCSIKKSLVVSLLAWLMSIFLFYLFFLKFVANGAQTRIPILLLFLVYLPMLHICVRLLVRFKVPEKLPLRTGWHLTVITGVCTFAFSFLVSGVICNAVILIESDYYFNWMSRELGKYHQEQGAYPSGLNELFDADFPPIWFVQNNSILWQQRPGEKEAARSRDYYHFLPLPATAPENLVWMWMDTGFVKSSKMPVMFFDHKTRMIDKKEFDSLLQLSRKWLTEHPQIEVSPKRPPDN